MDLRFTTDNKGTNDKSIGSSSHSSIIMVKESSDYSDYIV
jgi:hypothetical protein